MKKLMAWSLLLVVLFSLGAAKAADAGVVVIGGPESQTSPISLGDMKLGVSAEIPGYANVTLTEFSFSDILNYYYYDYNRDEYESKNDAEFALLYITVLNTKTKNARYIEEISDVIFTYQDEYTYGGFIYQCDPNAYYPKYALAMKAEDFTKYAPNVKTIKPLYEGFYVIGAALPNAVVKGKGPLTMTFKLGGNELTYNIRK